MDFGFIFLKIVGFAISVGLIVFVFSSISHLMKKNRDNHLQYDYLLANEIRKHDPSFDVASFKINAGKCVYEVFNCFFDLNLERLKILESSDLYEIHKIDIETGIVSGNLITLEISPYINFYLEQYFIDGDKEVICCSAFISSEEKCFDPKTKKRLNDVSCLVLHKMKLEFVRHFGVKTVLGREFAIRECPNCGAEVNVNSDGKCSYCDSVVINGEHSWVLNKILDSHTN